MCQAIKKAMTRQIKHSFSAERRRVKRSSSTGAGPGFPVGGASTFQGGGANIQFCKFFQKKKHTMKSRKCWAVGEGDAGRAFP